MVDNSEQLCKPTGSSTLPRAYLEYNNMLRLKNTQYEGSAVPFSQVRN